MSLPTTVITLIPPALPVGYCYPAPQQFATDLFTLAAAQFNTSIGNSFFNTGSGPIVAENRIYPWFDENGLWWFYQGGAWQRLNPVPAGSPERRFWAGSTGALLTYDGGSSTVTNPANTGPMWEVDTDASAKFVLPPGTLPNGTVINQGQAGGLDQVALTVANLPAHKHSITSTHVNQVQIISNATVNMDVFYANPVPGYVNANGPVYDTTTVGETGDNFIPTIPPYISMYVIKRTARLYYTRT